MQIPSGYDGVMLTLLCCVALHPDSRKTSGARFKGRTLWVYSHM